MINFMDFHKNIILLWLAVMLVAPTVCLADAREPAVEEAVKAAILFNFIRFVEWPVSIVPDPDAPRVVAIFGQDALQEKVVDLAASAALASRVSVLEVKDLDHLAASIEQIQVLYIARSAKKDIPRILGLLQARAVLTICDDENFVRQGGMMNYVRNDSRIRFDINLDEAEKSRLKMSAKLFGLARVIVRNGAAREGQ
jgi:hypothetical protein